MRAKGIYIESWEGDGGVPFWSAKGSTKAICFRYTMPSYTSEATRQATNNKWKTKEMLEAAGVKVPEGLIISRGDDSSAVHWFEGLSRRKVVVKPLAGSGSKGVVSAIVDKTGLLSALSSISSKRALLEEHIDGHDHRVLVVGGKAVAGVKRIPAHVIGDGVSSIEELVAKKNSERAKNPYTGRYPIKINNEVVDKIRHEGLTSSSVPSAGRAVFFQTIANIGAGGDSEDVTDNMHEDFKVIAEKCWGAFRNLAHCGVDLIAEDITKPASVQSYAVIEINANCDVEMHHYPTLGKPRNAAKVVVDYLFPKEPDPELESMRIFVAGKVQGVGYRKWLCKSAMKSGVSGTCENKGNGVEAVLEGTNSSIDSMLKLCYKGPRKAVVKSVDIEEIAPAGYEGFIIK